MLPPSAQNGASTGGPPITLAGGRYRIEGRLGSGSGGEVFGARDTLLERPVAIKRLPLLAPGGDAEEAEAVARLLAEARAAARLTHPHIVAIYDVFEEAGRLHLVLERVDGPALRRHLETSGPLPLDSLARLAGHLAAALAHAHAQGVVHRDVKPENVLLVPLRQDRPGAPAWEAKLTDLGIAYATNRARLTLPGLALGTPAYVAPEQALGQAVDGRADLYALGCLLYEAATGAPPFEGDDPLLVVSQHLHATPPPPTARRPDLPPAWGALLLRLLAKRPDDRPPSAAALLAELAALAAPGAAIPAAPSAAPARPPAHKLPTELTSFVGRERELAEVAALLGAWRLVTLTGPGGTGKTRVGLRVAADALDRFADGVCFVALEPIGDPGLVVPTVAQTLGLQDVGSRPPLECLQDHLRDRHLLLILDNFEQVLDAAPRVAELLAACPRLTALVTSRVALRVSGEREFAVPPLAVPGPAWQPSAGVDLVASLGQHESVRLFVERAKGVKADFVLGPENAPAVVAICQRVDGLPLAIELAAARVRLLDPPAILARLARRLQLLTGGARDLPARQQTLRNTIAWSHDLLAGPEQALFRRLAVFVGGCTMAAAEAVCEGESDVLDGVDSLAAQSLVQCVRAIAGDGRFVMLETIREFGLERLAESGELPARRRRHAEYYLTLAEEAEAGLRGPDARAWLERLEAEHDNLRAALEWSLAGGVAEAAGCEVSLRLGGALAWFWHLRGYAGEGRRWLARALAAAPAPSAARVKALCGAGVLAHFQRDSAAARTSLEQGLGLAAERGDRWATAWALHLLGRVAYFDGDARTARSFGERSLAVARDLGDDWLVAWALHLLGLAAHIAGDYPTARARYEQSLALRRELGHQDGIGILLELLGTVAYREGDFETARARYVDAVTLQRELGSPWHLNILVACFASLAAAQRQPERAVRLAGASSVLNESYHMLPIPMVEAALQGGLEVARQALGEVAYAGAWAEGRALSLQQAVAYALEEAGDG